MPRRHRTGKLTPNPNPNPNPNPDPNPDPDPTPTPTLTLNPHQAAEPKHAYTLSLVLGTCFIALLVNFTSFGLIGKTGPITFQVLTLAPTLAPTLTLTLTPTLTLALALALTTEPQLHTLPSDH